MNQYTARFSYCDCMGRLAFSSLFAICILAGCTEPNPSATCATGTCIDPAFPYCDADGLVSGTPGVCVDVSCTPGEVHSCSAGAAITCNATGNGYEKVSCALDCLSMPKPHCASIEPRYTPDICDSLVSTELTLSGSASFDPNLDSNCTGGVIQQTGGPELCVVHARTITVAEGAMITITGKPQGRALALVGDESVSIDGFLDVSAHGFMDGPGGGFTTSGGTNTVNNGGGGAGGKTPGGSGGNGTTDGGAANGGAAVPDPALLIALVGGASAYDLQTSEDGPFAGGGGGGALSLVSCRGSVSVSGTINAGGGGGRGGFTFGVSVALHGMAGGAGGYVVLQAANVSIVGRVFANGGAGGSGRRANGQTGPMGQDGSLSATMPAIAAQVQDGEGRGGQGAIEGSPPFSGNHPTVSGATSGAGGGSVGFLQIYTPRGVTPTVSSSNISPAFQPHANVPLR